MAHSKCPPPKNTAVAAAAAAVQIKIKKKSVNRHEEQSCGCHGGSVGWESGISRCKLLYTRWIDNKASLYS